MTPAEKLAYGRQGRWDLPAPEAEMYDYPEVGAGNRDILYGALGYRQLPSRETMSGLYRNSLGEVENNPMTMARPLMDFPTGGGGGFMDPQSRRTMEAVEQFRAFQDAQEAGAFNLPNTMKGVKGKNSMVFDARSLNPNKLADPTASIEPTVQDLTAIDQIIRKITPKGEDVQFTASATNRGIVVFPYNPMMESKDANKFLNKLKKEVAKVYPGTAEKAKTTTGYLPGIGKRGPEGNEATAPYSGEATSDLLTRFSELPQSVAQNLSESEAVRNQIREKALRDAKLGGARGDIQESRRFFSEADWPKAVKLIREGMTPAAAIAALGYSATSMAGEKR
jgi:S-ribosylhomocysteine lyase LuxS involved in autoinducer biosynthesis